MCAAGLCLTTKETISFIWYAFVECDGSRRFRVSRAAVRRTLGIQATLTLGDQAQGSPVHSECVSSFLRACLFETLGWIPLSETGVYHNNRGNGPRYTIPCCEKEGS